MKAFLFLQIEDHLKKEDFFHKSCHDPSFRSDQISRAEGIILKYLLL